MGGSKSGGSVTVGYHYYMNVHFALAHKGCRLLEVKAGGRKAWTGEVSEESSLTIDKPSLFGGPDREGGLRGVVDWMPGESDQKVNGALLSAIRRATGYDQIPAYRGLTTAFFRGAAYSEYEGSSGSLENDPGRSTSFLWSSMNPYFKEIAFRLSRCWDGWNSPRSVITVDGVDHANPAHIIRECLVNATWGLGYPSQDIDDDSFEEAADQLYDEGLGLSMMWQNQTPIEDFILDVCEHINASLVEDRLSGEWRLILIRDNYEVDSLLTLDESNCTVENFQRKTLSDTVNEVTVSYIRAEDGAEDTVTVQDLANFSGQGRISSQKRDYPGVGSRDLAFRLALRDLQTLSKPVAKATIIANRKSFDLYPGQAFKLVWPRLGLDGVIFRVGTMDLGSLQNGRVEIEAVEDVFGLPDSVYADAQPIGWVDTQRSPEPVETYRIFEPSYYELYTSTRSGDRLDWPEDVGFGAAMGVEPNDDSTSLRLYDNDTSTTVGSGSFTPTLVLTEELPAEAGPSTLRFDPDEHPDLLMYFEDGGLAWVDDELIYLTDLDTADGTVTADRGVLDTVPAHHDSGATVWFYRRRIAAFDSTMRVAGETADYKLLSKTSEGVLDPSNAPTVSYTFQDRQRRPYVPGNVRIEGEYFPEVQNANFDPTITWAHRDRTQQLADPTDFTAGDIGPEEGVTYHLRIYDEDGELAVDEDELSGTSFEWTTEKDDLGKPVLAPSGVYEVTGYPVRDPNRNYMVTWLPLDGVDGGTTFPDETGTTTWTPYGNVVIDGSTGIHGECAFFDGSGDYIQADSNYAEHDLGINDDFTIEMYAAIHPNAGTGSMNLLGKSNGSSSSSYGIGFNRGSFRFVVYTTCSGGSGVITRSQDETFEEGRFYHLAVSKEGDVVRLFVDGRQVGEGTVPEWCSTSTAPLRIGQLGYNYWFHGWIDNVVIHKGKAWYTQPFIVSPKADPVVTPAPTLRRNTSYNVKLKSQRDSLDSFQEHDITIKRAGYGYRYGEYYGGH